MLETATDGAWAQLPDLIGLPGYGYTLWTVEMLVRFDGSQKAGARIMERIEQQLAKNNVGHFPAKLPKDSTCLVLLYRKDDAGFGFLLSLVQQLATEDVNDRTNASVRQLHSALDGLAKISRAAR